MQNNVRKNNPLKKLHKTVYPCSKLNSGVPLVLLPGWGFDSRVWQALLKPLQDFTQVITLDLPEFEDNHWTSWHGQQAICQQIVEAMPPRALYAGWSLGGMLATQIASAFPDRVVGLITLATNVSFIKRDHWPHAMSIADFQDFYSAVNRDSEQALKRFRLLLLQGDQLGRQQFRWLQTVATRSVDNNCLLPTLSLLENINNCDNIHRLQVPGLHIFGERDCLVPLSAAQTLAALSIQHENQQQYCLLKETGHLVFWPSSRVVPLIKKFLTRLSVNNEALRK